MNKIAVWGGGVVAMLCAILLKKNQIDVVLWRPALQKIDGDNKRVFALNQASLNFLKTLDVWQKIPKSSTQPIHNMLVWDGIGHAQLSLNAYDLAQSEVAKIVEESALWQACFEMLKTLKIPVFESEEPNACYQEKDKWVLNLEAGKLVQADFLCVADGARSPVREYLRVPCQKGSYHQKGLVAKVNVTKPHQGQALQIFGAHGPLAFLPLANQNAYSMVWSLDEVLADNYLRLDAKAFCEKLNVYWDGYVGQVESIEGLKSFPLNYLHAKQYYGQNWLLLGDAAHHFHPLAGLGLNAGIADIICLEQLWSSMGLVSFNAALLAKYQRERKAKITTLISMMKWIKNCFGNNDLIWVKLRSFGMDWLNHQSLIKKMMMSMVQDL
jgi:2-octaprenylphenol hydroxylase